jgi:hypothetical protein
VDLRFVGSASVVRSEDVREAVKTGSFIVSGGVVDNFELPLHRIIRDKIIAEEASTNLARQDQLLYSSLSAQ